MKLKVTDEVSYPIVDGAINLPQEVYDDMSKTVREEIDRKIILEMVKASIENGHVVPESKRKELEKRFGNDILNNITQEESNED